jgi:hypothetical protein
MKLLCTGPPRHWGPSTRRRQRGLSFTYQTRSRSSPPRLLAVTIDDWSPGVRGRPGREDEPVMQSAPQHRPRGRPAGTRPWKRTPTLAPAARGIRSRDMHHELLRTPNGDLAMPMRTVRCLPHMGGQRSAVSRMRAARRRRHWHGWAMPSSWWIATATSSGPGTRSTTTRPPRSRGRAGPVPPGPTAASPAMPTASGPPGPMARPVTRRPAGWPGAGTRPS